jgi:hypothetical protein
LGRRWISGVKSEELEFKSQLPFHSNMTLNNAWRTLRVFFAASPYEAIREGVDAVIRVDVDIFAGLDIVVVREGVGVHF